MEELTLYPHEPQALFAKSLVWGSRKKGGSTAVTYTLRIQSNTQATLLMKAESPLSASQIVGLRSTPRGKC